MLRFQCSSWPHDPELVELLDKTNPLQTEEKVFTRNLICSKKPRRVCLPAENHNSLFQNDNLFQSLKSATPTCQQNPCPRGKTPELNQTDGFYRCAPKLRPLFFDAIAVKQKRCRLNIDKICIT